LKKTFEELMARMKELKENKAKELRRLEELDVQIVGQKSDERDETEEKVAVIDGEMLSIKGKLVQGRHIPSLGRDAEFILRRLKGAIQV
jgi:hypothetical protein